MARIFICGFELGSIGEAFDSANVTGISIQTSVVRSGTYAMRSNATSGALSYLGFQSPDTGFAPRLLFRSVRFFMRVAALPTANTRILNVGGSSGSGRVNLNTDGTITIQDAAGANGVTSSLAFTVDGLWHLVEFDGGFSSGSGRRVYVDQILWASSTATASGAGGTLSIGSNLASEASTQDLYFDDIIGDDDTFATSGFPGLGSALLLVPISDNSIGTWTGGAGGTSNLFEAINNIPPIGTATETDSTQIENATNSANQDATFNCTSYASAGIKALDKINAVMAIINDGEDAAAGTKTGGVWINSNPSQSAGGNTFNFGDDSGALGTFPSNWSTHVGPVAVAPSVTLASSPVVAIRAVGATTRVRSADFLGVYVDYTPAIIPKALCVKQAVNRASTY